MNGKNRNGRKQMVWKAVRGAVKKDCFNYLEIAMKETHT